MSIFDRLISTLTGGEEAAAQSQAKGSVSEDSEEKRHRFMARDDSDVVLVEKPVEKGLMGGPSPIWLHIQPTTQRLLLVSDLGVADGEELTARMLSDLRRFGWCEAVAYHAGYDQYWKMPSQEAILRTPSLYDIPAPLLNRLKLETRLVKKGEPRGFWMQVRIRTEDEVLQTSDSVA